VGFFVLVAVDLQRDGKPGVAEDELSIAGRNTQVLEQCGCGVSEMVQFDVAEPVAGADAVERPGKVARFDWSAGSGGKD